MDTESGMRIKMRQFGLESTICDLERDMMFKHGKLPSSNFVSVIKIDGVPILPPVLTKMRREEMRRYRQLASLRETERRSRTRHKLFDKIQSSLTEIDVQHGKPSTNDFSVKDFHPVNSPYLKDDQSVEIVCQLLQDVFPSTNLDATELDLFKQNTVNVTTSSVKNAGFAMNSTNPCCCEAVGQMCNIGRSSDSGLYGNSVYESLVSMHSSDFSDRPTLSGYTSNVLHTKTCDESRFEIATSDLKGICSSDANSSASSLGDVRSSVMSASSGEDEMNRTVIGADEMMQSDESMHTVASELVRDTPVDLETLTGESGEVSDKSTSQFQDIEPQNDEEKPILKPENDFAGSTKTLLLDQTDLLSVSEDDSLSYGASYSALEIADYSTCGGTDHISLIKRSESEECEPEQQAVHHKSMHHDSRFEKNDCSSHANSKDFAYEYGECVAFADKLLSDSIIRKINSFHDANAVESQCSRNSLHCAGPRDEPVLHISEPPILHVGKVSPVAVADKESAMSVKCQHASDTCSQSSTDRSIVIRSDSELNRSSEQVHFEPTSGDVPELVDQVYSLTSSMEDLRLRPSAKKSVLKTSKLDLPGVLCLPDDLEHESSVNIVIDPPADFLDHSLVAKEVLESQYNEELTEEMNVPCSNVLERQGKDDQIWRYLNSLDNDQHCVVEQCFLFDSEEPRRDTNNMDQSFGLSEDCASGVGVGVDGQRQLAHNIDQSPVANEMAVDSRVLTEDSLLELELEQYEQMKQRLLDEHRSSLQRLLAKQEHEMAELWNRLSVCGSGLQTSEVLSSRSHLEVEGDKALAAPRDEFMSAPHDGPLVLDVSGNLTERCQFTPPPSCLQSVGSLMAVSRAGVYYSERPNSSPVPSCSTSTTDESESDFAYKSPAVLRTHRHRLMKDSFPVPLTRQSPVFQGISSQPSDPNTSYKSTSSHMVFGVSTNAVPTRAEQHSQRRYVDPYSEAIPADVQIRCEKLSAAVKGYLTRRLLKTDKVLSLITTIWDTAEFALKFDRESPMKKGVCSVQDHFLRERILAQLESAVYDFHEILFILPLKERMHIIALDRQGKRDRNRRSKESSEKPRRISAATMKAIERKKKALEEKPSEPKKIREKRETLPHTDISKKTRVNDANQENERIVSRQQRSTRAQQSPRKSLNVRSLGFQREKNLEHLATHFGLADYLLQSSLKQLPLSIRKLVQFPRSPVADSAIKTRKIARSTNSHIVRNILKPQPSNGLATNCSKTVSVGTKTSPKSVVLQPSSVLNRHYAPTRVAQSITSSTISSKTG